MLSCRSEALDVTLEQFNPVSRVSRITVDGRLQPVALRHATGRHSPRLFEVERQRELLVFALDVLFVVERQCELDVLALDVLFVGERHTDRRQVGLGAAEPLRQRRERRLPLLG